MKKKLYDERKYKKVIAEIGKGCYEIFKPDNPLTKYVYDALPDKCEYRFIGACLSTSATLTTATADYLVDGEKILKSEHVIIQRGFRYCEHDGYPHINADDYVIFVDEKGAVWRIHRDSSSDHYIGIATWVGSDTIANAHHLPKEPRGPYYKYLENGASIPIKIECRGEPGA